MPEKPSSILPKWPFLAGDLVLVLLACFIVFASPKPMTALTIFACALSVILGMLVYVTPYLIEHLTTQQTVKLKQAKAEETLLKAVDLASDLLSRTETIHNELMKGILVTKKIPAILEEKSEEFLAVLDSDKLSDSVAELADLLARLESIPSTISSASAKNSQTDAVNIIKTIKAESALQMDLIHEAFQSVLEDFLETNPERLEQTKPISSRNPGTDKSEEELHDSVEIDARDNEPDSSLQNVDKDAFPTVGGPEFKAESEAEEAVDQELKPIQKNKAKPEAIHNEDGTTRLIVGAFIGISNKLYIRGEGPGLDWDKGIPMELVGIGKWEWKTHDAHSTVNCKVLINDEQWTDSENITIEPGTTMETSASF